MLINFNLNIFYRINLGNLSLDNFIELINIVIAIRKIYVKKMIKLN